MASWVCTVCECLNAGGSTCALCEQPRIDAPAAAAPPLFDLSSLSQSAPPSQAAEDPDSLEFALSKIRELEVSETLAAHLAGAGGPACCGTSYAGSRWMDNAMMASFYDVLAVLQPPYGEHGVGKGIFGFLSTREARPLRLVSHVLCADVRSARWYDRGTVITGDLRMWRACFSNARCANLAGRVDLRDADMVHLSGVEEVDLRGCAQITDAGLAHLRGVRVLNIPGCALITDAGLAHLTGIHTLEMSGCWRITDAGLAHLTGIHTLNIILCDRITDAGLAHLTGIHTLNMTACKRITDAGLAHLTGIHTLDMSWCKQITDAGLAHLGLTGIHTLNMVGCAQITDAGLAHLTGIHTLNMFGCNPATIAAARASRLPVFA
jgi:hypothetical protein